jgi:hypothetical protein
VGCALLRVGREVEGRGGGGQNDGGLGAEDLFVALARRDGQRLRTLAGEAERDLLVIERNVDLAAQVVELLLLLLLLGHH